MTLSKREYRLLKLAAHGPRQHGVERRPTNPAPFDNLLAMSYLTANGRITDEGRAALVEIDNEASH